MNYICVDCGYVTMTEDEINDHCNRIWFDTQKSHKFLSKENDKKRFEKLEMESVY